MVGTSKKIDTSVNRQNNRKKGRTSSLIERENSFISSTPALGSSASQFQILTSPIPLDAEESINWVSGDTIIFKTPKAPSPARTRRRTTMINFQKPLLNQSSAAGQNLAIVSPPGVKTRSRRSSIYTALKQKDVQIIGKGGPIDQTAENKKAVPNRLLNPNYNQPAKKNSKNKLNDEYVNEISKKIENTRRVRTTKTAQSQGQSVKRKVTEVEILPSVKRSKRGQLKASDVNKSDIQVSKLLIDETIIADTQQRIDSNKQIESFKATESTMIPESTDPDGNGLSVDKESPVMINLVNEDKENLVVMEQSLSIVNDPILQDKSTNRSLIGSPSKSFHASSEELDDLIPNKHAVLEVDVVSRHTKSLQSLTNVSIQANSDSSSQSKTKGSNHELKVTGMEESSLQLETVSFEDEANGFKVLQLSCTKQPTENVLKNVSDSNISIESTSQFENIEDEQDNLADLTFGYSTLSQRCTII